MIRPKLIEFIKKRGLKVSASEPSSGEEVWIKKGKNRLDNKILGTKTLNAITITPTTDGGINVTGTNSSSSETNFALGDWSATTPIIELEPTLTYAISVSGNTRSVVGINVRGLKNGVVEKIIYSGDASSSAIITGFSAITYFSVVVAGSQSVNTTLKIQLEQNSAVTTFEPYTKKEIYCKNENGIYENFDFKNINDTPGFLQIGNIKICWGAIQYTTGNTSPYSANYTINLPISYTEGRIFLTPVSGNPSRKIEARPNSDVTGNQIGGIVVTDIANYSGALNYLVIGI